MNEQDSSEQSTTAPTPNPWMVPPYPDHRAVRAYWRAQRRSARYADPRYYPGLVFGALLVLVGGLALVTQVVPGFDAGLVWAAAVFVLGALVVARALTW